MQNIEYNCKYNLVWCTPNKGVKTTDITVLWDFPVFNTSDLNTVMWVAADRRYTRSQIIYNNPSHQSSRTLQVIMPHTGSHWTLEILWGFKLTGHSSRGKERNWTGFHLGLQLMIFLHNKKPTGVWGHTWLIWFFKNTGSQIWSSGVLGQFIFLLYFCAVRRVTK